MTEIAKTQEVLGDCFAGAPRLAADLVGGDPQALAALMTHGEALTIERRDHMRATGDPQFKRGALDFLARVYPA